MLYNIYCVNLKKNGYGSIVIVSELEQKTLVGTSDDGNNASASSTRRVMKSGPKIYGQGDMRDYDPSSFGPQGVIRRTVLPGSPYRGENQFYNFQKGNGEYMNEDRQNMENMFDNTDVPEEMLDQEEGFFEEPVMEEPAAEQEEAEEMQDIPEEDYEEEEDLSGEEPEMDLRVRPMVRGPQPPQMANPQGRPVMADPQGRPAMRNPQQGRPVMRDPQGRPVQGRPMPQMRQMSGAQAQYTARVVKASRSAIKSPLFVLVVLFHIAAAAGSIMAVLMHQLNYGQIVKLLNEINIPSNMVSYVDKVSDALRQLDTGLTPVNIGLQVPAVLFALGLLLVLFCALIAKNKMSGIGFVFMKIVVIINMICACIAMLGMLIVAVAFLIAAWVGDSKEQITIAIIVLAAAIIITMFVVMYFFCYLATIKTIRVNSNKGESYGKVSVYVAFISIITSLFSVVGILSGIVNNEIASLVSSAGSLGGGLLLGIWLFNYRGRMKRLNQ